MAVTGFALVGVEAHPITQALVCTGKKGCVACMRVAIASEDKFPLFAVITLIALLAVAHSHGGVALQPGCRGTQHGHAALRSLCIDVRGVAFTVRGYNRRACVRKQGACALAGMPLEEFPS